MMRLLLATALMLFGTAFAETASDFRFSFSAPNERVNGQPMSPEEISHYDLMCELVNGGNRVNVDIPSTSAGGEHSLPKIELFPAVGDYTCFLATVDTHGLMSDYVEVVGGPIEYRSRPGAPTQFIFVVD